MANLIFDKYGWLEETCLSCDKCYIDDLFHEWTCDEKECPHKEEIDKPESEE